MLTGQQLAKLALRKLGTPTPTEFARRLGLEGDSRADRVTRWLKGTSDPNYEGTMAMLMAVEFLTPEGEAAWLTARAEGLEDDAPGVAQSQEPS